MKICFVAPRVYPLFYNGNALEQIGGAELQQKLIGEALTSKNIQVFFISYDVGQPAIVQKEGITFIKSFAPSAGVPGVRFFHPCLTGIWRALGQADVDVYYCRAAGFLPSILSFFCRVYGKKFVFAGASDTDFIPGKHLIPTTRDRILYRLGIKYAHAIIVQSGRQQALLKDHFGREGIIIRNIYNDSLPPPPAIKRRFILWVSRIRSLKRPMLFVQLAQALPQEQFVMIGGPDPSDPALNHTVEEQCAALPNIKFLGFQPLEETERYFDQCKLFVNTSEFEGFPNTFLQAWQRGIPVVSYIDPDNVIQKNSLGIAVVENQLLLDEIKSILKNPPKAENIRSYFLQNHSLGVADQYVHLFSELISS